ncbi:ROK family protein [Actinomadura sp. ATCC 31491]|uniref:ROK family protein n=1 Tax=Actinomadura luzonensis TaxID=2805427 RepID=A0ABT0FYJ6_9ACTN|nr:ROK family protein [Actinomadura luzonensis]MCK2217218.1 ROK family protein [Actinomadura luzonensis]
MGPYESAAHPVNPARMGPMECVVAVDAGGTTLKGGLVARDGTVLHQERRPTPRAEGPERVIAAIAAFTADLARLPADPGRTPAGADRSGGGVRVVAAGVAVPGLVTPTHAVFSAAFGWRDVPAPAFAAGLDLPVALGHDVRAAGEAELAYGDGGRHVLYLPIGTGIAGAVVLDGELYGGERGWAGQIGHVPVWPDGEPCGCGQRGCLAAYASASAVAARCGERSAEDVVRRARAGDPAAAAVWAEAVEALAVALATYTLVLDPEAVVIGGGLSLAGGFLLGPLRDRLAGRLAFRPPPEVRASRLGVRAGLLGAALLAWRRLDELAGDVHDAGA